MFLHHVADSNDIINENTKFNYNDHIKLAKKIIDYGNEKNKLMIMNKTFKLKSILPNIKNIYVKNKMNISIKNIFEGCNDSNHHSRLNSNSSNNSTANNSTNRSNNRTISHSPQKNENSKNDSYNKNDAQIILNNNNGSNIFPIKKQKKSRFFEIYQESDNKIKDLTYLVDSLIDRKLFFIKFRNHKGISLENLEKDLCKKIFEKSKDEEIKSILENKFI
jgi:hypothetical protein